MINLLPHQSDGLKAVEHNKNCALYWDMGLGKTFGGSERMTQIGNKVNLVICQKSKIDDWFEHLRKYYPDYAIANLTIKGTFEDFKKYIEGDNCIIGIINYDLVFRRPELKKLEHFTLMLDESSLIQNRTAKRTKFIMSLKPDNVILLSGTPTGGKYENLWTQLHLLGWNISEELYMHQFVDYHYNDNEGFPIKIIDGYKNVDRLKSKMRQYGCHFLKTEDVLDLPDQIHQTIRVDTTKEYRKFRKDSIILMYHTAKGGLMSATDPNYDGAIELVGDTILTKMLYERQLCGQYNKDKLEAFRDLLESTNDRLIVFYNFTEEYNQMVKICDKIGRPSCVVNGKFKGLAAYKINDNSVTFIQYQAGAMGLNLQKANKIVYFTPPLSSELFEQSKKRIHRIGQSKPCFYYYLTCRNSIEEKIYKTLEMRRDYTEALFEVDEEV